MKAMDVMVRDVVTVKPEADVASAIKLLVEHGGSISALPVVDDDGEVVGVVSEADLVRRTRAAVRKSTGRGGSRRSRQGSTLAGEFAKSHGLRVSEVMSSEVISTSEETPLGEIATLLERHRIKRVPVIRDGKLVGIVSRSNLIQALASASQGKPAAEGDRKIRLDLLSRLGEQHWTDFGARNIIVTDGVVHSGASSGLPRSETHLSLWPRTCRVSSGCQMR